MNRFIYELTSQSLGDVPFHRDSILVDRLTAANYPFHVAVHQVDAKNMAKGTADYVDEHQHDYPEINILLSEDGELVYDFTIGGATQRVASPSAVYIPPGVSHKANVVGGAGLYVCIILADSKTVFGGANDKQRGVAAKEVIDPPET